jgi:hypothetical protein
MGIKYYLSRFWLATSMAFYLFIPYLTRYTDEFNRFVFHWDVWDFVSLLFCTLLLGTVFFLCFIILYIRGNKFTKKAFSLFFLAVFGIAVVAITLHSIESGPQTSPSLSQAPITSQLNTGYFLWTLLGIFLIYSCFKHNNKIKNFCVILCFIVSPIIPILTFNALQYPTIISNAGSLSAPSESKHSNKESIKNVYIFIFDEWSYQRSFRKRKLITTFENLKKFEDEAFVFYKAFSPAPNTFNSMPSFLFQNNKRFTGKGGRMGFRSKKGFHPIKQNESIFHHARELGFYTCIIGSYIPYGGLLSDGVDFAKSLPVSKRLGDSFFGVAKYHLVTASLMLPEPFFDLGRRKITDYLFNRFQFNRNNATHEMFKAIVQNQSKSTFAVFHYMLPHFPYIYNQDGHKKFYDLYAWNPSNYYGNLDYLDKKIGEIISVLKESGNFDNSLIIMTSDHSWRKDPGYNKVRLTLKKCHVPLFIKFPYQDHSIKINSLFSTSKLGTIINKYLDDDFDIAKAKPLLRGKRYFTPPLKARKKINPHQKW